MEQNHPEKNEPDIASLHFFKTMYLKRTRRKKETVEELVLSRQEESELRLHSFAVLSQQSYFARGNKQHTPVLARLS